MHMMMRTQGEDLNVILPKPHHHPFKAALELNTCIIMPAAECGEEAEAYGHIIPLVTQEEIDRHGAVLTKARLVSIEYSEAMLPDFSGLIGKTKKLSRAPVIVRVPAAKGVEAVVARLAHAGAEIIHIVADYRGRERGDAAASDGRVLKDVIRASHLRLIEDGIRDEVTLIASGGIAMAEHVPKAMLCGADLTAVDIPLMVALGAMIFEGPQESLVFPDGLDKLPTATLTQRIVNLMGAWHSQLLEVMGAMGIREARRLRGESGRAIFFEEIDRETFGRLFRKRKVARL